MVKSCFGSVEHAVILILIVISNKSKMGYKKIDNRLRVLMENGIAKGHRSMFLLVGPKARDQVCY